MSTDEEDEEGFQDLPETTRHEPPGAQSDKVEATFRLNLRDKTKNESADLLLPNRTALWVHQMFAG